MAALLSGSGFYAYRSGYYGGLNLAVAITLLLLIIATTALFMFGDT
jgi:hypothetical protein